MSALHVNISDGKLEDQPAAHGAHGGSGRHCEPDVSEAPGVPIMTRAEEDMEEIKAKVTEESEQEQLVLDCDQQWDFPVSTADDCFFCLKYCSVCGSGCEAGTSHSRVPCLPGFTRRVGLMHVCGPGPSSALDTDHSFWCVFGPAWPMSLCMVFTIIAIPAAVFSKYGDSMPVGALIGGLVLTLLVLLCFLRTAFVDPGLVPRSLVAEDVATGSDWRWLPQHNTYTPPGVQYASEGQVLVRAYDHFCIWTGTLIAYNNISCFFCWIIGGVSLLVFICVTPIILVDV